MSEIRGDGRTVRELLKGVKYRIDYYQREYKWEAKQIRELLEDLAGKFLEDYRPGHSRKDVENYGHYFLGSIIISRKDNASYIVDGQQRLTSLTLMLIVLRHLQQDSNEQVNVDELIYSEKYGEKSFNMDVGERAACMRALFDQEPFDVNGASESVRNIVLRYEDIREYFPEELSAEALPYFIDWLLENVHLVEITAYSDNDAYTIFETMNDRGLSLSPTDMLKGYLLANVTDDQQTIAANDLWKKRIQDLAAVAKDTPADSIKAWLRSQHAEKIREGKKGALPEDFDLIGTEFHRWVRDNRQQLKLGNSDEFYSFIQRDFDFYTRQYLLLMAAAQGLVPGLEHVRYNADHGFTLQYMLLLAPLQPGDSPETIRRKIDLVAHYLDILLTWRLWNYRSIAYSTMRYTMFGVMRDIRGLDPGALAIRLRERLDDEEETFASQDRLRMHQQNRWYLHRILARMSAYIEEQSGEPSHYLEYVASSGSNRYEVEHIWADKPERHRDEFEHDADFHEHRNRIGGLLLLPRKFNASYGALPYTEKLGYYFSQNLLARSLHPDCYDHNPGFLAFVRRSGLPFEPHPQFRREDLDQRQALYQQLAETVWNPEDLR